MSIFDDFATDQKAESEGVWVEYSENDDGTVCAFKVSRMVKSNKKYKKALERATKPVRRQMELGTLKDDKAEDLFLKVFVETVLLDWRNVQTRDGKEIPFTKEKAIEVMKALPDLYDDLQAKANEMALFRQEALEEEAKN